MLGRRQFFLILAAVVVVSVGGGWVWSATSDDESEPPALTLVPQPGNQTIPTNAANEGTPLPTVDLFSANGDTVSTADLYTKPVVVNFWFSTCEPCRREMPVLQEAHKEWEGKVDFIGVNPQDNPEAAEKFAAKYGVDYQLLLDRNGVLVSEIGVSTFPTTLFVNTAGNVVLQ
ncbi:MAG: TlpA family protein disulfide reductase, partial [Actinobacteria bacterium]|nr:TlpA family protein disulfide reductase [Actinomycetota bacterium]